jgi:imidazolonepropionase-like amidohydrolase
VLRGRTIEAVGPDVEAPAGATVVDGRGATLLPGFLDAHTHTWGDALVRAAVFGVTTELDMFTMPTFAQAMRAEQADSGAPGRADLLSAGYLATAPGGHGTEYGLPVPTLSRPEEAAAWVDARLAEGSDYVKIVSEDGSAFGRATPTLDGATIAAVIAAAHARGRLAVVHVSTEERAIQALEAGADGLVHAFVNRAASDAFVELAAAKKAFVAPTLTVVESTTGQPGGRSLVDDARLGPYLVSSEVDNLGRSFPLREHRFANALDAVRRLAAAGVPILAGTDAPNPGTAHGASIHRELELLVSAGLTPLQALAAATSAPAKAFGLADRGRIAPGLRADLVLVEGDPTSDVTGTRAIRQVWKLGQEVPRPLAVVGPAGPVTPAAAAPVPGSGLVSDFEGGTATAGWGAAWQASTDQLAGGKSQVAVELAGGGAGGSARALDISGELRAGFAYPWAGAMLMLGGTQMEPVDLSRFAGVSFAVRAPDAAAGAAGAGGMLLVFARRLGNIPAAHPFEAGAEWRSVTVPFAQLGLDGTDVQAIFVGGGPALGTFRLHLDDVRLVPEEAPGSP